MSKEIMQQALDYVKEQQEINLLEGWDCTEEKALIEILEDELKNLDEPLSYEEVHSRINIWKERSKVKPQPVITFTESEEGLWMHMECNGAHFSENLSESQAAEFFVNAYRSNHE